MATTQIPEFHGMINNEQSSDASTPSPIPDNSVSDQSDLISSDSPKQPIGMSSLTITDFDMYYRSQSYVSVKNSGQEEILLQSVSYGGTQQSIPNLLVRPGEEQRITLSSVTGSPGSTYPLVVKGSTVTGDRQVTAQAAAILMEPESRLEATSSGIEITGSSAAVKLTLKNSGMDVITVHQISVEKPIPSSSWAGTEKKINLSPGELRELSIQLDSLSYLGISDQYLGAGMVRPGLVKHVTVQGENSLGRLVAATVTAAVSTSKVEVIPGPQGDGAGLTGIRLPMTSAAIKLDAGGNHAISIVVVNSLPSDVVTDSLSVNGVEIPGWTGMTILAGATLTSNVTTNKDIPNSDIGATAEIVLRGQISGSSGEKAYSTTSVVVTNA